MKPGNGTDAGKPTPEYGVLRQAARRLQLGSGILLWIYISVHLINHALGVWSIDIAERGLTLAIGLWQSLPGTILLYGAAGLHLRWRSAPSTADGIGRCRPPNGSASGRDSACPCC